VTAKGRTTVRVSVLSGEERRDEIARMLGGTAKTAQAVAHADEMLRRSQAVRHS